MNNGKVISIHIAPIKSAEAIAVDEVKAIVGRGLEGDRYYYGAGTFSKTEHTPDREVTLITEEALTALKDEYDIEMSAAESRRNILTTGVDLNSLVGKEFSLGAVQLRGIRLCKPCSHLGKLLNKDIIAGLEDRGGLRAQILNDGLIKVGDAIKV